MTPSTPRRSIASSRTALRRPSRRDLLRMTSAAAAGAAVAACTDPDAGGAGSGSGTLSVGLFEIPVGYAPLYSNSQNVRWVTESATDALYTHDSAGKLVPQLAAALPQAGPGGVAWTVRLRPGVRFHNGDELTADHVAAGLNFIPGSRGKSQFLSLLSPWFSRAVAVDPTTVRIELRMPYGILPDQLARIPVSHRDFMAEKAELMGTGPFRIDKVVTGQSMRLVRFDGYWGPKPALRAIEMTSVPDPSTRLVNLREGRIHIATGVQPVDVEGVRRDDSLRLHAVQGTGGVRAMMNMTRRPFDRADFRRALAHAMDREGVREAVFHSRGRIAQGPLGPGVTGYEPDYRPYPARPDLERARELLARSGVSGGTDFRIMVSTSGAARDIAQVLAENWGRIGLKVGLDVADPANWNRRWLVRDYDMSLTVQEYGLVGGVMPLSQFTVYRSASRQNPGYRDPGYDREFVRLFGAATPAERDAIAARLNRALAEDAVELPPVYPELLIATRSEVSGIDERALTLGRLNLRGVRIGG
ncbi:ABC transporter substrate-binding protein [Streptomyces sp. NPDC058953]|uniref:ABC transporter substrate-binding protein n=1 Tax=unclassified Streptomyces TaxID=2593676 RepID=UPI003689D7A0